MNETPTLDKEKLRPEIFVFAKASIVKQANRMTAENATRVPFKLFLPNAIMVS